MVDPIYAYGDRAFGLAGRRQLSVEDLSNVPMLLNARSTALRAALDAEVAARKLQIDIRYEVLHTHTALAFARAGLGVAILPGIALPRVHEPSMCAVAIGEPILTRTISIVSMRGTMLSPGAARLRDAMVESFRGA